MPTIAVPFADSLAAHNVATEHVPIRRSRQRARRVKRTAKITKPKPIVHKRGSENAQPAQLSRKSAKAAADGKRVAHSKQPKATASTATRRLSKSHKSPHHRARSTAPSTASSRAKALLASTAACTAAKQLRRSPAPSTKRATHGVTSRVQRTPGGRASTPGKARTPVNRGRVRALVAPSSGSTRASVTPSSTPGSLTPCSVKEVRGVDAYLRRMAHTPRSGTPTRRARTPAAASAVLSPPSGARSARSATSRVRGTMQGRQLFTPPRAQRTPRRRASRERTPTGRVRAPPVDGASPGDTEAAGATAAGNGDGSSTPVHSGTCTARRASTPADVKVVLLSPATVASPPNGGGATPAGGVAMRRSRARTRVAKQARRQLQAAIEAANAKQANGEAPDAEAKAGAKPVVVGFEQYVPMDADVPYPRITEVVVGGSWWDRHAAYRVALDPANPFSGVMRRFSEFRQLHRHVRRQRAPQLACRCADTLCVSRGVALGMLCSSARTLRTAHQSFRHALSSRCVLVSSLSAVSTCRHS